ncbi:MAG TPA: PEP-CTERM sorting domain-containing protein [Rhizomicrobium sp.]|nr:PEP-CTERM sorting domain-containing protein [Rhizomicrobium sp.]
MSMAALGLLAAFFMVLIALLLAPTLASANKDAGTSFLHDEAPDMAPPHGGPGGASGGSILAWNETGHDHGHAFDTAFCVAGGVYPCLESGDGNEAFDGGKPDSFENGGGGNPQGGDGWSNGDGGYTPSFWSNSGAGGGAGGGVGGGLGGDQGGDKTCTDPSGKPDSGQDDDKTKACDGDPDSTFLTLTSPGDLPSDFVDPSFGDDPAGDPASGDPTSGDGPAGDNPAMALTVTEVPEPLTVSLFAVGLAGAARLRRRSRQA